MIMKKKILLVCVIVITILLALLFYMKYGFQEEIDENKSAETTTTIPATSATLPDTTATVNRTTMPQPTPPSVVPARGGRGYDPISAPLNGGAEK